MKELKIGGLQKTTLLDFPGHVAATVFLTGCNYRCPFCHNAQILDMNSPSEYTVQKLLSFLKKRSGILEGVCITGGEPTLQPEPLEGFIRAIKELGLLVKLDTNGSCPQVLRSLISQGLLDYVAMDIKAAPDHYGACCGMENPLLENVKETVFLLKNGPLPYEFRTTCVNGLHTLEDFKRIGPWIEGCSHYYLQNYVRSNQVLSPDGFSAFSAEMLLAFAKEVSPFVKEVKLRGIDYEIQ